MGLLDKLKKIRKRRVDLKKPEPELKPEPKKEPQKEKKASPKEAKVAAGPSPSRKGAVAPHILQSPHITEKATDLSQGNQYIFKVFSGANKSEIKKAVEEAYNVEVKKVEIINIPSKPRRLGRTQGRKSGFKKAIVGLKQGQTIELTPR